MFYKKPYDGIKADIFSLGVLLLTLTTCKFGFYKAIPLDPYYNLIFEKHYLSYWKKLGSFTNDMSEDLKNLYLSMVSFKPKNRPSIDEILNSDWMKEIREMTKEQMEELENEVRNEFLEKEYCIKEGLKKYENKEKKKMTMEELKTVGMTISKKYLILNITPKNIQTGLNMDNYIKLK